MNEMTDERLLNAAYQAWLTRLHVQKLDNFWPGDAINCAEESSLGELIDERVIDIGLAMGDHVDATPSSLIPAHDRDALGEIEYVEYVLKNTIGPPIISADLENTMRHCNEQRS